MRRLLGVRLLPGGGELLLGLLADRRDAEAEEAPAPVNASELPCVKQCGRQAVAFWPAFDPDIPSHPYCRECLDAAKFALLLEIYEPKRPAPPRRRKRGG